LSFDAFGLRAELLRAVREQGYDVPTPVQVQAIPLVLEGHDLLAAAQTGTGKTAGFVLPMLQRLMTNRNGARPRVRALVLTPTRELATQVTESIRAYGRHLPLKAATIFGGVGIGPQVDVLRRGVDIVVATPGRLLDHVRSRSVDLSAVEIFVLDEGDRMLDMGFIQDIRRVLEKLPPTRQNLLFSATFSEPIRELAARLLDRPRVLDVARRNAVAANVDHTVYRVDRERKSELLAELIHRGGWTRTLVFTRTKHGANRLAEKLVRAGISADAIHGNKSQSARTRALGDFKAGHVRALVATEIAARGLDIEDLPHVVNFELPFVPEDYVHRIGRTARAGASGQAHSLVCVDEDELLRDIERVLRHPITVQAVPGFAPDPRVRKMPIVQGRGSPPARGESRSRRPRR
jgi:ATP-dependent RNA helicase RhlE